MVRPAHRDLWVGKNRPSISDCILSLSLLLFLVSSFFFSFLKSKYQPYVSACSANKSVTFNNNASSYTSRTPKSSSLAPLTSKLFSSFNFFSLDRLVDSAHLDLPLYHNYEDDNRQLQIPTFETINPYSLLRIHRRIRIFSRCGG